MKNAHLNNCITAYALRVCMLSVSLLLLHVPLVAAQTPSKEIIEKVMKRGWDKVASTSGPKVSLTINSVKLGKSYKATLQEVQVEGIPDKAMVTPALIDFTVRTYNANATNALQRVREARVYKDKFDEWAVMTGSVKGQDITTKEPAAK